MILRPEDFVDSTATFFTFLNYKNRTPTSAVLETSDRNTSPLCGQRTFSSTTKPIHHIFFIYYYSIQCRHIYVVYFFTPRVQRGFYALNKPFFRFHVTFSRATKSGTGKVHFRNALIRVVSNSKRMIYVLYSMEKGKGSHFSGILKVKNSILRKSRFVVFP